MARQALTMSTALEVEDFLEKRLRAKNPVLSDLTDPQIYGQVASGRKV
jgi:hypothetical protein